MNTEPIPGQKLDAQSAENQPLTPPQKTWIILALVGSVLHTIRDVQQCMGVETPLSNSVVKESVTTTSLIWHPLNTVIIEVVLFAIALCILRRNTFGALGKFTVAISVATALGFVWYWFFV